MLTLLLATLGLAGTATLHVGVPEAAGSLDDIVAEGVPLPCTRQGARVTCEASGPLTFRWAGSDDYVLHGEITVPPGDTGRAWVLSTPERGLAQATALRALASDTDPDRHTLDDLRRLTVFNSDWTPPWPSPDGLDAWLALLRHPDARIRRHALEGLHPWVAGTPYDPLPLEAPSPLTPEDLRRLARDRDVGVRRRVARILRDARPDLPRTLVAELLGDLLDDPHRGVRRAAIVALPGAVDRGVLPVEQAWSEALERVPQPAPPGRAASNQLAALRSRVRLAGVEVDVEAALERVLEHHPERAWRVWRAWHRELPVREAWIRRLLEDTVGMDPVLVRHWQRAAPDVLDRASAGWVPARHPERAELLERLRDLPGEPAPTDPPADDSLSGPPEAPEGR